MNYSVQSVVPSYTFPENKNTNLERGNRFLARPIRQWRKQLQATNGLLSYRRTAVGIPSDRPGGTSVTTQTNCQTCNGAIELKDLVQKDSACTSCHITRTSIGVNNNSYTDNAAYLESKCTTYDQKLAYNPVSSINYFSPEGLVLEPTNSPTGPQVRATNNCYIKCNTTIYKPNNSQFAQQGGVNSGSRIARLKYNTLNNYGAQFNSAKGAIGVNTGRYVTEPSPSYYTKLQPQKFVIPYKTGAKTYCPEYNLCND
jgi:hypothetical protein